MPLFQLPQPGDAPVTSSAPPLVRMYRVFIKYCVFFEVLKYSGLKISRKNTILNEHPVGLLSFRASKGFPNCLALIHQGTSPSECHFTRIEHSNYGSILIIVQFLHHLYDAYDCLSSLTASIILRSI